MNLCKSEYMARFYGKALKSVYARYGGYLINSFIAADLAQTLN